LVKINIRVYNIVVLFNDIDQLAESDVSFLKKSPAEKKKKKKKKKNDRDEKGKWKNRVPIVKLFT
jgi:hypothetical protein